jgi:hypothetical protein
VNVPEIRGRIHEVTVRASESEALWFRGEWHDHKEYLTALVTLLGPTTPYVAQRPPEPRQPGSPPPPHLSPQLGNTLLLSGRHRTELTGAPATLHTAPSVEGQRLMLAIFYDRV